MLAVHFHSLLYWQHQKFPLTQLNIHGSVRNFEILQKYFKTLLLFSINTNIVHTSYGSYCWLDTKLDWETFCIGTDNNHHVNIMDNVILFPNVRAHVCQSTLIRDLHRFGLSNYVGIFSRNNRPQNSSPMFDKCPIWMQFGNNADTITGLFCSLENTSNARVRITGN